MTQGFDSITERLEKVETENRRLKRIGVTILLTLAAVLLMGQTRLTPSIETQRLIIRDVDGKMRAELGVTKGVPQLKLYDTNGGSRLVLFSSESASALGFYDAEGKQRTLLIGGTDATSLNLSDQDGYRAVLGTSQDIDSVTGVTHRTSAASVTLVGKDGQPLWSAP